MRPPAEAVPFILLAALITRAGLFLVALPDEHRFFTSDAEGYVALARDLRAGYQQPESPLFVAGLSRPPGYPLFVAAVLWLTGSLAAVVAMQILLAVATVWVVYLLGRELLGARAAALGAMVLALDPASVIYTNQLQPEALFTLLVTCAMLAWVRSQAAGASSGAAVAGLFLGLAILTRPIALYLPLVLLAWSCRSPARNRLGALLLAPVLLLAGGWIARNAAVTGVPLLSTIQGVNLLEYRAAGALAYESAVPLEVARDQLRGRLAPSLPSDANPAEVSRAQTRLAFDVLREHPRGWIMTTVDGVFRLLAGTGQTALSRISGDHDPESARGPEKTAAALALMFAVAAQLIGALTGVVALWRGGRRSEAMLLIGVAAYFVLIPAGPEANTRFRVPAEPFLALLAGAGGTALLVRAAGSGDRATVPRLQSP